MYERYRNFHGRLPTDGVVLADRCPSMEEWNDPESESWVARVVSGQVLAARRSRGLISGFWVSPSGHIYVAGALEGSPFGVHVETTGDPYASTWHRAPLDHRFDNVWGVDDEYVFAWGSIPGKPAMALFDGRAWTEIEPPGEVLAMHGVRRDLIFAVGGQGLAAWWDGSQWNPQPTQTKGSLSTVWTVSDAEVYATGIVRRVMAGSIYGWSERVLVKHEAWDIAKWNDRVWIAAGYEGLAELKENKVVAVDPALKTRRLVPGDLLLVVTDDAVVATDGTTIRGSLPLDAMRVITNSVIPHWET